jgi:hypothetical protein
MPEAFPHAIWVHLKAFKTQRSNPRTVPSVGSRHLPLIAAPSPAHTLNPYWKDASHEMAACRTGSVDSTGKLDGSGKATSGSIPLS